MDGVLVDVSNSFRRAVVETARELGSVTVSPAEVQAYKDRGGFNNDWILTHAILRDAGRDVPYDEVVEAFNRRYRGDDGDGLIAEEPPLARTETLEALAASGELALVTGRPLDDALFTLRRFGWERLFPVVVGMEEQAGREKPDPYPLRLALDRLAEREGAAAVDPAGAVYAGDTVDDVRSALAAGLLPVGVVPPYLDAARHSATLRAAGASEILLDVNHLPALLAEIAAA
jgi:HAD superfamily phosphatase